VGSFNLDPRSSNLNREIGVFVDDRTNSSFADELLQTISSFRDNALLVGKDGKHFNQDIEDLNVPKAILIKVRALQLSFKLHPWLKDQT
jgi:phosphatidylserine/phosphatidylglycerophosphate/cardiolipin synthase-like enzyme